tara:strand:+ start:572 stop:859 length:288 start_codon:yes stop_codon:yes gene_type:complete
METFGFVNENDFCNNIMKDKTKINTIYGEIKKEVTDYLNTVNIINNTNSMNNRNSMNNTIQIKSENKIVISNQYSNHFIIDSDELPKGLTLSSLD